MDKFLEDFINTFKENYNKAMELDDSILNPMPFPEWTKKVLGRSQGLREIFKSNDEIINNLKEYVNVPLNDERANDLFMVVKDLYSNCIDDLYILKIISEKLIEYYEKINDFTKLPYLYNVIAFESYEFYCRIGKAENYIDNVTNMYKKVVSFEDKYFDIDDYEQRHCIVSAYSNLIAPVSQIDDKLRKDIFDIYHSAVKFFDEKVYKIEEKEKAHTDFINLIETEILFMEERIKEMTPENIDELREVIKRLEASNYEDFEGNLKRCKLTISIYDGEITYKEAIEQLIKYIYEEPLPDYDDDDDDKNLLYLLNIYNCAETILAIFDNFDIPSEEKEYYVAKFIDKVTRIITKIPYTFVTGTCNNVCAVWFNISEKYLTNIDDKKSLLYKTILCRQPITYIHSVMVSKIATMITEKLLEVKPELFDGTFDYDVRINKSKVLKFVEECALLHDIGKCQVSEVINRQNRRLTDYEFDIIKLHPEKGLELLGDDPDFDAYYDVMLGHHKTYDDLGGYPQSFKKNESKIKFIIDIISIADSTDAATDIYGRNYTAGKDFNKLYGELVQFKGTRYNPDIVDVIGENKDLYYRLSELTSTGRSSIYYGVYDEILKIK